MPCSSSLVACTHSYVTAATGHLWHRVECSDDGWVATLAQMVSQRVMCFDSAYRRAETCVGVDVMLMINTERA